MNNFRNRFCRLSVLLLAGVFLVLLPLSRPAAAGLFVGGAASLMIQLGRIRALHLAGDSVKGIKWSITAWGFLGWAVYAAVFYIGYEFCGGRAAGVVGAAAGLAIPLAGIFYAGATEVDAETTAD
jgi:hypothetical protein